MKPKWHRLQRKVHYLRTREAEWPHCFSLPLIASHHLASPLQRKLQLSSKDEPHVGWIRSPEHTVYNSRSHAPGLQLEVTGRWYASEWGLSELPSQICWSSADLVAWWFYLSLCSENFNFLLKMNSMWAETGPTHSAHLAEDFYCRNRFWISQKKASLSLKNSSEQVSNLHFGVSFKWHLTFSTITLDSWFQVPMICLSVNYKQTIAKWWVLLHQEAW